MNFKNILNLLESNDPEVFERTSERRSILKSFSSKVAVAALPFAVGSFFKKAYGKNTDGLYDALTFALSLEYLEADFYKQALENASFIPEKYLPSIQKLAQDETAHVNFLTTTIGATGSNVPPSPVFNFTGGGAFPQVFTDFSEFLILAQAFEDLGVRAYKGQVPTLRIHDNFLTAAMRIHSVEAEHASHIRYIRRLRDYPVKPWITNSERALNTTFFQNVYRREDNATQNGVNMINYRGYDLPEDSVTEAFDEPLIKEDVQQIVAQFIVK